MIFAIGNLTFTFLPSSAVSDVTGGTIARVVPQSLPYCMKSVISTNLLAANVSVQLFPHGRLQLLEYGKPIDEIIQGCGWPPKYVGCVTVTDRTMLQFGVADDVQLQRLPGAAPSLAATVPIQVCGCMGFIVAAQFCFFVLFFNNDRSTLSILYQMAAAGCVFIPWTFLSVMIL